MTEKVTLRPAGPDDSDRLFAWVNDPLVRRMSFSGHAITRSEHDAWFVGVLANPNCQLFVVETSTGDPVGQIRLDTEPRRIVVVSVSIAPQSRGRGYGHAAIAQARTAIEHDDRWDTAYAFIKPDNTASMRAFAKAGFGRATEVTYREARAVRMSWP